jgi:acetoin utilization deacetylase AcuC-like enzyme
MLAFHYDHLDLKLPPGHRFPQSKYRMLRERLQAAPGLLRLRPAPAATAGEVALVHTPDYVAAVLQGGLDAAQQREIGFPWTAELPVRSLHSVGATMAAARAALQEGVAANLAGGTHHAYAHKGSGFCVFNDVAVAARLMQQGWREHHPGAQGLRVLVIDLDVHQGNGTAAIFQGDDSVFTFSMHGEKNFPFRKEASDLDLGLPDACGDSAYLQALSQALAQIWQRLAAQPPGLAFYLAGADPHEGDRLGRLKLSAQALLARDQLVLEALRQRGIPVALCMAGGYGQDLAVTVDIQVNTLAAAAHSWSLWDSAAGRAVKESPP